MILPLMLVLMLRAAPSDNLLSRDKANWEKLIIGAPTEFAIDDKEHHGSHNSLRIDSKETARSYWRSDAIPVAPGEQIGASAWVKLRDVPAGRGAVIVIAEYTDGRGYNQQVEKFGVADAKNSEWQRVEGSLKAPAGAAQLRLRLGFSYCQGTCWWDDVQVRAEQPLVARIDLDDSRLSPALEAIPISILNRSAARGAARMEMSLGKASASRDVELTGEATQRVDVPIQIAGKGKRDLSTRLYIGNSDKPVFTDERKVTVPPPITLLPPVPTHWVLEDGPPKVSGEVDLAIPKSIANGAAMDVQILDEKSDVLARSENLGAKKLVDGWNHFEMTTAPLPEGDYTLIAELRPTNGEPIRAKQPWHVIPRRLARVTINADGYCVHDGKAIFPLGIFNGGAHVKEMGEAGFTVNHAYNAANAEFGEKPNDQGAKNFLDASETNGMKVCFLIPRGQVFHGDWEALRHRVRLLRNHPALLCWDEEEGIARGDMPPEYLAKLRQIIKEEDPNHPLMVGDPRDMIGRVTDRANFFPVDQMDLGMWWWYPLPLRTGPTTANALEGEEATHRPELVPPEFLVKRNTDKPIWVGLQSYKKKDSRYPTPVEYRAQAYIAIIHGAKGLMWYGGSVTGGIYLAPEEGHWDYLKKLARELRDLSPVFMSPNGDAPKFAPTDAPISVCLKRAEGGDVLLAVNRGLEPIDVTFELDRSHGAARVLSEDRQVNIELNKLRDHFEPLATHIFELPAK